MKKTGFSRKESHHYNYIWPSDHYVIIYSLPLSYRRLLGAKTYNHSLWKKNYISGHFTETILFSKDSTSLKRIGHHLCHKNMFTISPLACEDGRFFSLLATWDERWRHSQAKCISPWLILLYLFLDSALLVD